MENIGKNIIMNYNELQNNIENPFKLNYKMSAVKNLINTHTSHQLNIKNRRNRRWT